MKSNYILLSAAVITLITACAVFCIFADTNDQSEGQTMVKYEVADSPDYSGATAPRTMSITLPTPPAAGTSAEARSNTLALVIASALMLTALIGAMAYIYLRNRNSEFSPDESILDSVVGRLAVMGLFGMVAAYGLLLFTTDEAAGDFGTPIRNWEGQSFTNVAPPDTIGDVGPSHYVQMVNHSSGSTYEIYDKDGTSLGVPKLVDTIEDGYPFNIGAGDPIVIYDHLADRWLISEFLDKDVVEDEDHPAYDPDNEHHFNVFISKTGTPTYNDDDWWSYAFECPNFPDYPKITLWDNGSVSAYLVGTNSGGNAVYALPRDNMLAGVDDGEIFTLADGDFIRMETTDRPNWGRNHIMPADIDGPAAPSGTKAPFVRQVDDEITNPGGANGSEDYLEVWEMVPDFDTPGDTTYSLAHTIAISEFDYNLNNWDRDALPQNGSPNRVDALLHYIMWRLQYRNFGTHQTLVANFTVDVGTDEAGIRWFELRNTGAGWYLYQEGDYAPDGDAHYWMASAAMDGDGNIALGYSYTDDDSYPSIRYTGRLAGDALGTMPRGEHVIATGDTSQNWSMRWGDYSSLNVDPVDDTTFWYTNEYVLDGYYWDGGWTTQIAAFSFQDPDPIVSGDGGGNNIILRRNADDDTKIEVEIDGVVDPDHIFMLDALDSLTINGGGGDDTLTVDFGNGDPIPSPDGVTYNGGTHTNGDDLVFENGSFTNTTYDFLTSHTGAILLDGSSVYYTGIEPITSTITATNIILNYSTTGETLTIDDSGTPGMTEVTSSYSEFISFVNPSTSLQIFAGNTGDDTINLNDYGSGFTANITINGGTGTDSLTIDGTAGVDNGTLTNGNFDLDGLSISFSGIEDLTFDSGGDDDQLTVDFIGGNAIPSGGLFYNGGIHTVGDSLTLQNGSFTSETYTVTGPDSGTITFDGGSPITFTGLEPIYDTVELIGWLSILLTSADETVHILDGPGIGSFNTVEVSGPTFESIEFAQKAGCRISGFDGADTYILNNTIPADDFVMFEFYGNHFTASNPDDGSADRLNLLATAPSTLTHFNGEMGDDRVSNAMDFGGVTSPNHLDDLGGTFVFNAGPGDDLLHLQDYDTAEGPDTVKLWADRLLDAGDADVVYTDLEGFFFEATPGADTIDITSTHSNTTYIVSGDGDSDTITIGNQTADFNTVFDGSLDDIQGRITIWPDFNETKGSGDILNIDDSGTGALDASPGFPSISDIGHTDPLTVAGLTFFDSETTRLEGFAPAYIEYAHGAIGGGFISDDRLEYLNILTSTGDDTVLVYDTTATVQTTIDMYTGHDSNTLTINGDGLSGANIFKGNMGNDRIRLQVTNDLGASSVFPLTSLQVEGNDPAGHSSNWDVFVMIDSGTAVRNLDLTYITPVAGNVDITGLAVPINVRTMEFIDYRGDVNNDDILTVIGSNDIDSFHVLPNDMDSANIWINGGMGPSLGPDMHLDGLDAVDGLTIDGAPPPFFTEPGDYLLYDGSGLLTFSGPGTGKIDGVGVLDVNFEEIEILDATGTFMVYITADSLAPGNMNDASGDTFLVYRDPTGVYHRMEINGTLLYNIVFAAMSDLTIDGSGDDDILICDFGASSILNPIPPFGIYFNGYGQTADDVIYLQNGMVITIIYYFHNATDGIIEIDGLFIYYTGLSPIYDNLDASHRIFNFIGFDDNIRIYQLTPTVTRIESDSSSELVEFLSPAVTMTVNMGIGDDVLTIGDDDPLLVPGFADDFTAALTINGDGGWDTINVRGPVGTPLLPLDAIAFNVQLANLYQPMYSPNITGTCLIVNVWYPGLIQNAIDIAHPTDGCLITVYPADYPENLTNWKPYIHLRSAEGRDVTSISADSGIILDLMTGTIGFILGGSSDRGFTILSTGTVDKGVTGVCLVDLLIAHNSFDGPGMDYGIHITGVTATGEDSLILKNDFHMCGTAIAIFNGCGVDDLRIARNCMFDSIDHGILLAECEETRNGNGGPCGGDMVKVIITENTLSNGGMGIKVEAGEHIKADFFMVKFNNFLNNGFGLMNLTEIMLVAKHNFWGASDGPYAEDNPNGIPNPVTGYGSGDKIGDYVNADLWSDIIYFPSPCDLVISLDAGWNLVSINVALDSLNTDYTASVFAHEMNSQAGDMIVKYIVDWDPDTGIFREYVVDSGLGENFSIEYGRAYYVYSVSPFDLIFHIVGDCPVYETMTLKECWNLIGWLSMDTINVGELAEIIDHFTGWPSTQAIVKYNDDFDNGQNEYIAWYPGMDPALFQLVPGEAYWVFVAWQVELSYP